MSFLFNTYARRPLHLVDGKGTIVCDEDGNEYLDFTSGIAVVSIGHSHPAIVETIIEQSGKLWHVSNLFESPGQEKLAESLTKETHLSRAFFCNSGAEANEAAIKLARKHTGKQKIITFEHSFHGRTFGAMSATGQEKIKQGFGRMLETFITVPFNDPEKLLAAIDDDVAAIMLEVVQGEGGVHMLTPELSDTIMGTCETKGILCIVDEVQTGIGRTGTRYAFEQTSLKPDIITLAKGLGGGFPIGAMLGKAELADSFGPGTHGSTFGGNPLAVAVAQTVVNNVFAESFLESVLKRASYLSDKLNAVLPPHVEVRGKGLLVGIDCKEDAASFVRQAEKKGLLVVGAGNDVIRLLPPLTVSEQEIDRAIDILAAILPVPNTV